MTKRERVRFLKDLQASLENAMRHGVDQLSGSIWYIEGGAEIKAFDTAYAAQRWFQKVADDLKKDLTKHAKIFRKPKSKRRSRKRR